MKNRIIYALLGLFLVSTQGMAQTDESWRANVPKPSAPRAIEIGEYNSFKLKNGLQVIVVENHKLPKVSYQLILNNDSFSEGDQIGFVSIAGELLGRGTKKRTKAEIDEEIDFMGASLSTSGGGIFGTSLKKHTKKFLDIFTDVLYNPSFPQEEFDKIVKQQRASLKEAKSDAGRMVRNTASVLNFGENHPYGEIQTEKELDNIKIETLKRYYKTYFVPNNATLVMVGDITPKEAKKLAKKRFCKWKKGNVPEYSYDYAPAPTENRVALINKEGAVQSVVRVTYPISLKPGSDDELKATVMNNVLGTGFGSRLTQNLREDKGYTYGARSFLSSDKSRAAFGAYASVRNEVTDSSLVEFVKELKGLTDRPVTPEELKRVKSTLAGSFARSLESPQTIANFAYTTFEYNLPKDYYNTYLQRLDAITLDDVNEMVAKYIKPENMNIVVAGAADEIEGDLIPFDADGVIEYFDAFGNPTTKPQNGSTGDVTIDNVMSAYVDAIGGKSKLESVKTVSSDASMSLMGQTAKVVTVRTNDKFLMDMSLGSMQLQKVIFNGTKVIMSAQGQTQELTDDKVVAPFKEQAVIFPELAFNPEKYELKGTSDVEGEKAYKVSIKGASGSSTKYYSVKSGLLLKSVESNSGKTQTTFFKDYKAVDGVLFPHTMVLEGMMPQPLEMKIDKIEINPTVPAGTFK